MTIDTTVLRRSVTEGDYADDPRSGAANVWLIGEQGPPIYVPETGGTILPHDMVVRLPQQEGVWQSESEHSQSS